MIRGYKGNIFHHHRWINDLLYHLGSLEVYSIAALNARHHFVSKWHLLLIKTSHLIIPSNKDETYGHKESQKLWKYKSSREVKRSLINGTNNFQVKKLFLKVGNLSKSLRSKYAKTWRATDRSMCFMLFLPGIHVQQKDRRQSDDPIFLGLAMY
jgi:hypothetical protein